ALSKVSSALKLPKFKMIISSPDVAAKQKVDLLVESSGISDQKMVNLLKLLVHNKKIEVIPAIAAEGRDLLARQKREYHGFVYAQDAVSESVISELERRLHDLFKASVKLAYQPTQEAQIKVVVPDMGVEAEFSKEKLKNQLVDHILRAI
ncbi:MAG: F0F1 ATP synthase subunit delta, partial [Campylobacterales bacterium]